MNKAEHVFEKVAANLEYATSMAKQLVGDDHKLSLLEKFKGMLYGKDKVVGEKALAETFNKVKGAGGKDVYKLKPQYQPAAQANVGEKAKVNLAIQEGVAKEHKNTIGYGSRGQYADRLNASESGKRFRRTDELWSAADRAEANLPNYARKMNEAKVPRDKHMVAMMDERQRVRYLRNRANDVYNKVIS